MNAWTEQTAADDCMEQGERHEPMQESFPEKRPTNLRLGLIGIPPYPRHSVLSFCVYWAYLLIDQILPLPHAGCSMVAWTPPLYPTTKEDYWTIPWNHSIIMLPQMLWDNFSFTIAKIRIYWHSCSPLNYEKPTILAGIRSWIYLDLSFFSYLKDKYVVLPQPPSADSFKGELHACPQTWTPHAMSSNWPTPPLLSLGLAHPPSQWQKLFQVPKKVLEVYLKHTDTNRLLLWLNGFFLCLLLQRFRKLHLEYKLATLLVFIYTSDILQKWQGNTEMNHYASALQNSRTEDLKELPELSKMHNPSISPKGKSRQWWEWPHFLTWFLKQKCQSCVASFPLPMCAATGRHWLPLHKLHGVDQRSDCRIERGDNENICCLFGTASAVISRWVVFRKWL